MLPVWGLIFGGAYTWWGLFSEFYGTLMWLFSSILLYLVMYDKKINLVEKTLSFKRLN